MNVGAWLLLRRLLRLLRVAETDLLKLSRVPGTKAKRATEEEGHSPVEPLSGEISNRLKRTLDCAAARCERGSGAERHHPV